jgi:hypothetical protein
MRAASRAFRVGGTVSSASASVSARSASSCSTNSGLPSAASISRPRTCRDSDRLATSPSMSESTSGCARGSRRRTCAFRWPLAHAGRASSSCHQLASLVGDRLLERGLRRIELERTSDERRRSRTRDRRHVRKHAEQLSDNDGRRLALEPRRPRGSMTAVSCTSSNVCPPSRTSPACAFCSSRFATFTASPLTSVSPPPASGLPDVLGNEQRRSAPVTEPRVSRVGVTALGANGHSPGLRRSRGEAQELFLAQASPSGCSSPARLRSTHQLSSAPNTSTFAITYSQTRRIAGGPNAFSTGLRFV